MQSFRFLCGTQALGAVLAVAVLGLGRGAARAEEETRPEVEIGIHGGGHFFSDTNRLGRDLNPTEDNVLRNSGVIGARIGLGLGRHFMPEVELAIIPTETMNQLAQVTILGWRAHLLYHITTTRLRPFILAGAGALSSFSRNQDQLRDQTVGVFHMGAGLKLDLSERFGLRLDGRMLLPPDAKMTMAPEWELLAGLYLRFGLGKAEPKDSDGDGVVDPADKCPNEKGLKELGGCPDKDDDGDEVLNLQDKCPNEKGLKELGGCPDKDDDGDEVLNLQDKCPNEKGLKELGGCPDKDDDGDGVLNLQDKCPTEPGMRELFGCPDQDGDGIPDGQDRCPDKPETKNNYQDEDGCPDEIPRAVKRFTGVIQGINFVANKYDILPSSFGVLNQAVKVLTDYPDVKLEIQGHTDTSGQLEMNRELSQKRAEAVKAYFVQKGIAPERLRAIGYGPDKPLADNKTAAGRARNRRVEFQLINTADVPPPPEASPQEKTPE